MLSFGVIIDFWIVDYYGVDEVVGYFHRRDVMEIRHLAVNRLKARLIGLVDKDTVDNPLGVVALGLESEIERVARVDIADGQTELREPHTTIEH